MPVDVLIENDQFVSQLRRALGDGASGLSNVPALLKCVLRDGRWQQRKIKTGDVIPFTRFEEFVTTPPLEGLGADVDLIRRIVADDPEAVDLLDRAINHGQGERKELHNNVMKSEQGNSQQYALRKLREARPDLHERVIARELSAHAAMVEAGFRPKTVSIPLDPHAASRLLVKHFQGADLDVLIRDLTNWAGVEVVGRAGGRGEEPP